MKEAYWLSSTDPQEMLDWLRQQGKLSERKARLFAAASFGQFAGLLSNPRQRRGIEALEQWAEGGLSAAARRRVTTEVRQAIPPDDWVAGTPPTDDLHYIGLMLYREFCCPSAAIHAIQATAGLAHPAKGQRDQVRVMHCIFGHPFRLVTLSSSIRTWNGGLVRRLAEATDQHRIMPAGTLDLVRLAVLSDALEECGADAALVAHLREPGPHWRGCHALDLIMGRG